MFLIYDFLINRAGEMDFFGGPETQLELEI